MRSYAEERVWITNISKFRLIRVLQFIETSQKCPWLFVELLTMLRSMRGTLKTTLCCVLMTAVYLIFFWPRDCGRGDQVLRSVQHGYLRGDTAFEVFVRNALQFGHEPVHGHLR